MKKSTDAWSTSCLSHRPSEPAYYIVDCRILPLLPESSSTNEVSLLRGVGRMKCSGIIFEGACLIYAPTFFRKIFCNLHKPFFKFKQSCWIFSAELLIHDCQNWESRDKLPREKGLSIKEFEKYLVKSPTFKDVLLPTSEIISPHSIVPTTYPPCRSSS